MATFHPFGVGGGPDSDTTAIHVDQPTEISGIANKAAPVAADVLVIEDSADSFNKRSILLSTVLGGSTLPGAPDNSVQTNNGAGGFAGSANLIFNGTLLSMPFDTTAAQISLGTGTGLRLWHSGTESVFNSNAGDLLISNTGGSAAKTTIRLAAGGAGGHFFTEDAATVVRFELAGADAASPSFVRLGSDTSATSWQIRNNSGVIQHQVRGNGEQLFGTGMVYSESGQTITHVDSFTSRWGSGNDFTLVHNGSNAVFTNVTGNVQFDNQSLTGAYLFDLGTDTAATSYQVRNNSGASIWTVDGAGNAYVASKLGIGIPTTTPLVQALDVFGTIRSSNAATAPTRVIDIIAATGAIDATGAILSLNRFSANDVSTCDGGGNTLISVGAGLTVCGGTGLDGSAVLKCDSTTRGFLPSSMTTTQRLAISSPTQGLLVDDLTVDALFRRTASAWEQLAIVGAPAILTIATTAVSATTDSLGAADVYRATAASITITISKADITAGRQFTFKGRATGISVGTPVTIDVETNPITSVADVGASGSEFIMAVGDHGYAVGTRIVHTGFPTAAYNGSFVVTAIPATFRYQVQAITFVASETGTSQTTIDGAASVDIIVDDGSVTVFVVDGELESK